MKAVLIYVVLEKKPYLGSRLAFRALSIATLAARIASVRV